MTNETQFRMSTSINGLEIVTGLAGEINVRISHPKDERHIMAYQGSKPYISLAKDTEEGITYIGERGEYDTINEAIAGHTGLTNIGLENPDIIRHSTLIKNLRQGMKDIVAQQRAALS